MTAMNAKTVLLYKYRLRNGHTAYTFNHSITVYGGNEWLASQNVELPEGVSKLRTRNGIVLKKGESYAPIPLTEGGDIVAYFLGAGRITICKEF